MITLRVIGTFDELDVLLSSMNETGVVPALPFIDDSGTASIAHGTAPGGDGWAIDYEAPRDPDTGLRHCCECYEHNPIDCDCGALWEPSFPITVMIENGV